MLIVHAEAAASPAAAAIGVGIERFFSHEFGNVLVGLLFVAAEIEKLVT